MIKLKVNVDEKSYGLGILLKLKKRPCGDFGLRSRRSKTILAEKRYSTPIVKTLRAFPRYRVVAHNSPTSKNKKCSHPVTPLSAIFGWLCWYPSEARTQPRKHVRRRPCGLIRLPPGDMGEIIKTRNTYLRMPWNT